MKKYVLEAGFEVGNRAHGLHSLRHTLASRLLEEKVPLYTFSALLGHADIHSTQDYLHIDIEELRRCALELSEGEFMNNERPPKEYSYSSPLADILQQFVSEKRVLGYRYETQAKLLSAIHFAYY